MARPLDVYEAAGLIAGPREFPLVAALGTLAGPRDSTWVLLGISLPVTSLRFERRAGMFEATYSVSAAFSGAAVDAKIERAETVRVAGFEETRRTGENVIFQAAVLLPHGRYSLRLQVHGGLDRDHDSSDSVAVPAYGAGGRAAAALVAYRAQARGSIRAPPGVLLNPRHTVPYGGDPPLVHVEVYDATAALSLRVRDAQQDVLFEHAVAPARDGAAALAHETITVPADALPIGRHTVELLADTTPIARMPLIVSITDQWLVSNYEEVLQFLAYIATPAEVDSLARAQGAQRRAAWDRFWARRDPLPETEENEFRDAFFERVRDATLQFAEPGSPGWRSDRGMVYIVLGAPDFVYEREAVRDASPSAPAAAIQWVYESVPGGRLALLFIDRSGFGRFELALASEAEFRVVVRRLRQRD